MRLQNMVVWGPFWTGPWSPSALSIRPTFTPSHFHPKSKDHGSHRGRSDLLWSACRRAEPTVDSAMGLSGRSAGVGAGASTSRDVDWTILEAQRMLSLDPWGMALSRRRYAP